MEPKHVVLPCVEIEPERPAEATVIWLHGLGADGNDFVPLVPHLGLDPGLAARFVFPHAPAIPVTINMGMVMPAWYDITAPDLRQQPDRDGIARSAGHVRDLLIREVQRGVPIKRIVLAGFSQGGAIAVFAALRCPQALAGAIGLSTYLVLADTTEAQLSPANHGLAVFQAHGTADPLVPLARGQEARATLARLGCAVTWRTYPMQHVVCMEEIRDVGAWLNARLRPDAAS